MKIWLFALAALIGAPAHAAETDVPQAMVTHDDGRWTVEYSLPGEAPAWIFRHSEIGRQDKQPWRLTSWTVETPGLRLERHGWHDVLVADDGSVPARVRIAFKPYSAGLETGYDPALAFTDGAVALFTDQFDLMPLGSAGEADALPLDLDETPLADRQTEVSFADRQGQVLHHGVRTDAATTRNGRSYVLFGSARIVEADDIATIIDPALPTWLTQELAAMTPRLLAYYSAGLGAHGGAKPTLLASWAGATPEVLSMGGSVLPGMVLMAFEGEGVTVRNEMALRYAQWFIAHEAAHFWLGGAVHYDGPAHAWMTEGGADLIAVRAVATLDPGYDPNVRLNEAIAKCETFAKAKPVNSANERGEHDAYYACGAVWALVAEAAAKKASPGAGINAFWRELIETNRDDETVSDVEWLAMLTRHSSDPSLAADIRAMTADGVADPRATIRSLFERAGVAHSIGADGRLLLQ